ncbi:MAG: helix-turn-helix transcriptional regulator [Ignavibacteria bacterium]|jgi:transcriptional regulator with XRE-family HTH domain
MEGFGKRLKDYAKSEHKSVRKLAEKINKRESTISQYINDIRTPGADFLYQLAKLGCDINWLLTGEKYRPSPPQDVLVKEEEEEELQLIYELQARLDKMNKRLELLEKDKEQEQ